MGIVAAAATPTNARQRLFLLARSKNANVVEYAASVSPDQLLSKARPLTASWIMRAEDGRRERLGDLERLAYGFSVTVLRSRRVYELTLKAFPDRPIKIVRRGKRYVGELAIGGVMSRLVRIFVHEREGILEPTVESIELFGVALATGRATHERVVRH